MPRRPRPRKTNDLTDLDRFATEVRELMTAHQRLKRSRFAHTGESHSANADLDWAVGMAAELTVDPAPGFFQRFLWRMKRAPIDMSWEGLRDRVYIILADRGDWPKSYGRIPPGFDLEALAADPYPASRASTERRVAECRALVEEMGADPEKVFWRGPEGGPQR